MSARKHDWIGDAGIAIEVERDQLRRQVDRLTVLCSEMHAVLQEIQNHKHVEGCGCALKIRTFLLLTTS